MEEPTNLQDWVLLSDSDTDSIAFEEIIHSDYFALDSSQLNAGDEALVPPKSELSLKGIEISEENLMNLQLGTEKSGSFFAGGAEIKMGFGGIEPKDINFDVIDPNYEVGIGETNKGGSFLVDYSKIEVQSEGTLNSDAVIDELGIEQIAIVDSFQADDPKTDLGFEGTGPMHHNSSVVASEYELGTLEIQKGGSFLVNDSRMEAGIEEIDSINQNSGGASDMKELRRENINEKSQELGSHSSSSIEMSNSESIFVGEREKKVLVWWKLPLDILRLCASRMRPVWSIPIAAAVIGILMVGRRLCEARHKRSRIPLKVSFEDKKAASQLLLRAAHLNEVVVRRVPIISSPLLPASDLTPWPVVGLL